ncbi:MAG: HEAT repeat domain-containing protein [Elusimicrobia bacterium]|nr:HEAT repeat domain-containing protein [Elusimicrobiota bacterium]
MKTLLLLSLAVCAAAPARAARLRYELSEVEVYGSGRVSGAQVASRHADAIRHMLARFGSASTAAQTQAEEMRLGLEKSIKAEAGLGHLKLSIVDAGRSANGAVQTLLLLDAIDKEDMERRYPFRPAPASDVKDVSGLLDKWTAYEALGRSHVLSGEIDLKRTVCPAFYCPEGSGNAEMNSAEAAFVEAVPGYKQLLLQILREDSEGADRARALFLLTYLPDAADVTALVSFGLSDPDVRVREAAVTIFNDLAIHRKDVAVPFRDLVRMLDYPDPADRQRALALLLSLADNAEFRPLIFGPPADQVLRLLRSKHPGVRQMAHTLLTLLSGESHKAEDNEAWDKWLWRARQSEIRKGSKD